MTSKKISSMNVDELEKYRLPAEKSRITAEETVGKTLGNIATLKKQLEELEAKASASTLSEQGRQAEENQRKMIEDALKKMQEETLLNQQAAFQKAQALENYIKAAIERAKGPSGDAAAQNKEAEARKAYDKLSQGGDSDIIDVLEASENQRKKDEKEAQDQKNKDAHKDPVDHSQRAARHQAAPTPRFVPDKKELDQKTHNLLKAFKEKAENPRDEKFQENFEKSRIEYLQSLQEFLNKAFDELAFSSRVVTNTESYKELKEIHTEFALMKDNSSESFKKFGKCNSKDEIEKIAHHIEHLEEHIKELVAYETHEAEIARAKGHTVDGQRKLEFFVYGDRLEWMAPMGTDFMKNSYFSNLKVVGNMLCSPVFYPFKKAFNINNSSFINGYRPQDQVPAAMRAAVANYNDIYKNEIDNGTLEPLVMHPKFKMPINKKTKEKVKADSFYKFSLCFREALLERNYTLNEGSFLKKFKEWYGARNDNQKVTITTPTDPNLNKSKDPGSNSEPTA